MRRILVLPDIHAPYQDQRALDVVLNYAAAHKWTEVVQLGDLVDFNSISAHNKGKPKLVEGERVLAEVSAAEAVLADIRAATDCVPLVWLKGNHEWRWDRFVEEHPALEGLVALEDMLLYTNDKLIECYPHGAIYRVGKVSFTHGVYVNKNHATTHAQNFGCNVVYGHTHQVQQYAATALGKGKAHGAWSMGCLSKLDMPYLEGRPSNWQHAFGEVYVEAGGLFSVVTNVITNGVFVGADGVRYSWKG